MLRLPSFKERPFINSIYETAVLYPDPRSFNLDTLMYWIKRTPECIGILKRIATDIVTDISFVSTAEQKTGRPSKSLKLKVEDQAYYFSRKNNFRQKLRALVIDWLATGDFYLWKGRVSNIQTREIVQNHLKDYGIELKEVELDTFETKQFYDEDWNGINSIEIVPSSRMKIHHDKFKILKFVQQSRLSPNNNLTFNVDEIIHGKLMEIDGSVYGFSPFEACYPVIRTINSIQDYNYFYFENGAKIDRVWKFMGNVNPDSVEGLKQQLKRYKHVKNAHGDIVISGAEKIETETLNEVSEKMEFRDIMINAAGRLAAAFNMSADTFNPILGKDVKNTTGSSDVEDAGYNRNINQAQTYIEELLNTQLWIKEFNVEMRLERTFRQDQIRYAQYLDQATPTCEFLWKHEFPLSDEFFLDFLQLPRKYLIEGKIKREVEELPKPGLLPNKTVQKGTASQGYQAEKTAQQKPQARNNPPSGS
jgi:hypothetical protein